MPLTLETVLGTVNQIDDSSILYVQVERAKRLTITANFAKNVTSGYVVAEVPEKLEDLISNTIVNEECEKAFDYIGKIEEWNKKEKEKLEEYELEQGIREEDAKKDPAELIFDALERKGKPVEALRSPYRKQEWTPLRTEMLLKFLTQVGLSDEYFQEDIKAMLENRELLDEEGTWKILKEQLDVKVPTYEPPEIDIREVPPLLDELESVVSASYNRTSLEEINLIQQAWDEAGINPQDVYDKVNEGIKRINSQYMLIKVNANGSKSASNLKLMEIAKDQKGGLKQSVPKSLKSIFKRPADVVSDAYSLSFPLWGVVYDYLINDEESATILKSEKSQLLGGIIFKKILGRETSLIDNLFANIYGFDIDKEETKKYRRLANKVDKAIKKGLLDGENNVSYESISTTVPVVELMDTIRYLIDTVPEELYRAKYANNLINWTKKEVYAIQKKEETERKLNPLVMKLRNHFQNLHDFAIQECNILAPDLGILTEGLSNWQLIRNPKDGFERALKTLPAYGLIYKTNQVTAQAAK